MMLYLHIECVKKVCLWLLTFMQVVSISLSCNGRKVITNSFEGTITDGQGKYPKYARCEWLIEAPLPNQYITLEFINFSTECSFDYLFVHDGNSYKSKLLGTFSGTRLPDTISASSGYMLIFFNSDRNYMLNGFEALYKVTDCSLDCSGHGDCKDDHKCQCQSSYYGSSCQYKKQLECSCKDCGAWSFEYDRCVCKPGFAGINCGLSLIGKSPRENTWTTVSPNGLGIKPRTGHASAFIEKSNSLWIFGGNDLNTLHNDLVYYDFNATNKWVYVAVSDPWPSARQEHKIVEYLDGFYMFGGVLEDGVHTNELWLFNTTSLKWKLIALSSRIKPIGVSSHSLTLVDDVWLYVYGGKFENGTFSALMYRIQIPEASQWQLIISRGRKTAGRNLNGHSAVFHKESRSILVFGGMTPNYARFSKRVNSIHVYHIDYKYWSEIKYDMNGMGNKVPKVRTFHTANIMGNYMVVYGGNCHIHSTEEICYDNSIYLYHLGCHFWVDISLLQRNYTPNHEGGRFGHSASVAYGNTLLITGGYRGNVFGDLIAYTVPPSIALHKNDVQPGQPLDQCNLYRNGDMCLVDPECSWCKSVVNTGKPGCLHRHKKKECKTGFVASNCPGICGTLGTCTACTVQGQGPTIYSNSPAGLSYSGKCAWCVQEAVCRTCTESTCTGACTLSERSEIRESWWGKISPRVMEQEQCRMVGPTAGLLWIKHRPPVNLSYPDEVSIIRETKSEYVTHPKIEEEIDKENLLIYRGFIHPLDAPSVEGAHLLVYMGVAQGHGQLRISTDSTEANKEVVADLNVIAYKDIQARRPTKGVPIFQDTSRIQKYFVEFMFTQKLPSKLEQVIHSVMSVVWTGYTRHLIKSDFLEPYNSGSCSNYDNCLMCMTDTSCGWCTATETCVIRKSSALAKKECGSISSSKYLILDAGECPMCSELINCQSCVMDPRCEWLAHHPRCTRRGRYDTSLRNISMCPEPCIMRNNCTTCLDGNSECAWCEKLNICFPFAEYLPRYIHGECAEWVDYKSDVKCRHCSHHLSCKSCLSDYQCGWCGNTDNPTIGKCIAGDFTGPYWNQTCAKLITEPAAWSYGICPDVEECRLELHDCHPNATCNNTFDAFTCVCNRGYTGDGRKSCVKTCYHDCRYGTCSGPPDYQCQCEIGWTAENCSMNCGCFNHSTCTKGIGICDRCEHWTTGVHCELCQVGSYGNATIKKGCMPCICNSHGVSERGYCDGVTGKCYCQDNTEGDTCNRCKPGYYGNPSDGGKCYLMCKGRSLLTNVTSGALGTYMGSGMSNPAQAYCLWVLSAHEDFSYKTPPPDGSSITFTMEHDIKLKCSNDYVHVYDGLPQFVADGSPEDKAVQIAVFCGQGLQSTLTVEAKSGILTVYFEANIPPESWTEGFNATFHVNRCSTSCSWNRVCSGTRCICRTGYGGVNCDIELCPSNCSAAYGRGACSKTLGMCICFGNYVGPACNETGPAIIEPFYDPWRVDWPDSLSSPLPRMGHTMVSCDGKTFYMFGGVSVQRGSLQDLWEFDTNLRSWKELKPKTLAQPKARYFHAAVCVPAMKSMFMFGGHMKNMINSAIMWMFSIDNNHWKEKSLPGTHLPRAGHTMTLISDTRMVIIGGFSTQFYYNEKVDLYDASTNTWQVLPVNGAKPTGLYGHTAVYHKESEAIYVYGGYEYQSVKTVPSDRLYALDLRKYHWSILSPSNHRRNVSKMPRYFHAAVTTENYMLVLGGRSEFHSPGALPLKRDFTNDIQIYIYSCNIWLDITQQVTNHGEFTARIGHVAVMTESGKILIFGGYDGRSYGSVAILTLPDDYCTLFNNRRTCKDIRGCSACSIQGIKQSKIYCYNNTGIQQHKLRDSKCNMPGAISEGIKCNIELIQHRDQCDMHENCMACTVKYPIYPAAKHICKWCSNCGGKCIPYNRSCDDHDCFNSLHVIKDSSDCLELKCDATDCEKCINKTCVWSRQLEKNGELKSSVTNDTVYDWNCVRSTIRAGTMLAYPTIQSMPPDSCPMRCHRHNDCTTCLDSRGGEGGWHRCVWSQTLKECMPPAYLPLHCVSGNCYHIISDSSKQCPTKCSVLTQCSHCLNTPGCGWCTIGKLDALDGIGVCMEGGIYKPTMGRCETNWITLGSETLPASVSQWIELAKGPPTWSFGTCPPENECLNGHHTCRKEEQCKDTDSGFVCECKHGYTSRGPSQCVPVCTQGCAPNGVCVEPNVCKCNFGYVGHNCSTPCDCNGHSHCVSVEQRDKCTRCMNNTKGPKCQWCEPLFVGDPKDGGSCIPCEKHCNKHTDVCISPGEYNASQIYDLPLQKESLSRWRVTQGPTDEAVCVKCKENTMGNKCQRCVKGYYRLAESPTTDSCKKCECNGHSDECDEKNGINCRCHNNTETRCPAKENSGPCHKQQCSTCKEYFMGTPTDGHQCYRQVNVDRDYCFDPITQRDCGRNPSPLPLHQTVFFVVQPKYLNVDIRITIDVSKGAVDVFFSPKEDTFLVLVDEITKTHCVCIDYKYEVDFKPRSRCEQTCARHAAGRSKRSTSYNNSTRPAMKTHKAKGLTTFITIGDSNALLFVRDVQFRLVITLPLEVHDLQQSRFYMVLFSKQAVPDMELVDLLGGRALFSTSLESYGNLYFRQDQPHIDLFVFFSVFFSCFFLFLDLCVLFWKIKQGFDERRSRQRREQEMECMASRPFAKMLVFIDDIPTPQSSPTLPRKNCLPKIPVFNSSVSRRHPQHHYRHSPGDPPPPYFLSSKGPFHVAPIALEPTDDGIAAVGTVIFHLPGGSNVPVRSALGSALITTRVLYASSSASKQQLRRRTVNT